MYYRRLPKFEYFAPKNIEDVCSMIKKHNSDARISAGGSIMIHRMKERVVVPKVLISLKQIPELDGITFDASSGLKIGAMTKLQSVADSALVKENYNLLSIVCNALGTPQVRNMGTIGGNVTCKLPAAETVPALIALKAQATIVSSEGERMVTIEDLNKELTRTDLLTHIFIPASSAGKKWGYEKFAVREKLDYATASAAVVIFSDNTNGDDYCIALGGVPQKRATEAEKVLKGQPITDTLIDQAAGTASENAKTSSDIEFSAEYKKKLIKVMVKRALKQALAN